MRTNNSIKNSITVFLCNSISFIAIFFSQAIFVRILGPEYVGMNGLFTNILSLFSIFELGIGNAIVFNLYKPIAENNYKKIAGLMNFYKKAYRIIFFLILFFGLLLIPFIKMIVGTTTVDINIYIVYLLFLGSTLASYVTAYKRNLIIADQKNYIINIFHMVYLISLNVLQLMFLFFTKNFYIYLIIKIFLVLIENISLAIYTDNNYRYIGEFKKEKLDQETFNDIIKRVRALIFHKIGSIVVYSTDNIIISYFFGIVQVGLYTNYNTIVNALSSLFGQIISTCTSSIGNLMLENDLKKKFEIFKKIRFLNYCISIFTSVLLINLIQPFIEIWVGHDYLLHMQIVFIIVINYYQRMQRNTYSSFKDSAGIWIEDKYVPIIESVLNIVCSIIFLKFFGLGGVFIGTILSSLILWCYSYPKFVYKKIFKRSYKDYILESSKQFTCFIIIIFVSYFCISKIVCSNIIVELIINMCFSLLMVCGFVFIIFRKSEEYIYYKNLIFSLIRKIKKNI